MNAQAKSNRINIVFGFVILTLLYLIPFRAGIYTVYLLNLLYIYIIITTGLNILTGYAGQISFGQSAFAAIGAYSTALLMNNFHVPVIISIMIGGALAFSVGFILGFPILKLAEIYLAMVTLALTMITQLAIIHLDFLTNGVIGVYIPVIKIFSINFATDHRIYYIILTFAIILFFSAKNITSSILGRSFSSIKDSETAAESLGLNISLYKSLAFAISSFYAAIGGGLYAVCLKFIAPEDFGLFQSLDYFLIIVIGGLANLSGPIYGSIIIILMGELLRAAQHLKELSYGVLLLICILFFPGGFSGIVQGLIQKFRK